MINLGNKIRALRKKKGITQEQLASALNMSPQAVLFPHRHALGKAVLPSGVRFAIDNTAWFR
ncbi:MAG: helix-turn-helix transcriptional regulator [Ruminococcaceae bacterium]|nr:helix-turn-helix transcriptional regulator [Oscillospiraceae bacterium]